MTIFDDINGVYASGVHCGIKTSGKLDLAYIFVPSCVGSSIVQSQHAIRSATLDHNDMVFNQGPIKLMIINSGNANSMTGDIGFQHIKLTVEKAAEVFGCNPTEVGVASTGIIGVPLPIEKLLAGLNQFSTNETNGEACAEAILTTDLVTKHAKKVITVNGKDVIIEGITKGSGMIAPNMATTLGFIVTNASLTSDQCQSALVKAIDASYNMCSVDTDKSTNDLVSLQATGEFDVMFTGDDYKLFEMALTDVCIDLAKQIVRDGEGADHFIEVTVSGAETIVDAKKVAKLVVESPLVKTAVSGNDPNWGRIVMAMGKDPSVAIDLNHISIGINGHTIYKSGMKESIDRDKIKVVMATKDIVINIGIGTGNYSASAWGCDLTKKYIDINTEYT